MHVTVSSTFPQALRPEIEALVRAGFADVECDDVEAHVKARAKVERRYLVRLPDDPQPLKAFRRKRDALEYMDWIGPPAQTWVHKRAHPKAAHWTARSYDGVPRIARVREGTAYLVTFNIPADPRDCVYPVTHQDPRLKTSPIVTFTNWQENLCYIAAHEARHIHQYRHGLSRSELDAERWAATQLHAFCMQSGVR